jgi:hypothetical protein
MMSLNTGNKGITTTTLAEVKGFPAITIHKSTPIPSIDKQ